MKKLIQILGCLGAAAMVVPAVTLNTTNTGYFNSAGDGPANGFMITGSIGGTGFRGFTVFDMIGQAGTVSNVNLSITQPSNTTSPGGSWSGTIMIYDVSAAINNAAGGLLASYAGPAGAGIYTDLGAGTLLGSASYSNTGNVTVALNASGVAAVQAAATGNAKIAFGLSLANVIGAGADYFAFNYVPSGSQVTLTFDLGSGNTGGGGGGNEPTVPEPGTVALVGSALIALGYFRKRQ